jgi:integrase
LAKQAIKWYILQKNPCSFYDLPRKIKKEMKCLSPKQTVAFLETAKQSEHFCLFLLAIETGLRSEEYLGLKWSDISFENAVLSVQRAIIETPQRNYRFDQPKTATSRRSIPLSKRLIGELKLHRRKQLEQKLKLGCDYQTLDLVFADESGEPFRKYVIRERHFQPLLEKAGLPKFRLYDLRHTTATLLLSEGISPKVVSERLGHSSVVITLDVYSHVLPTMQADATDKLQRLLKTS